MTQFKFKKLHTVDFFHVLYLMWEMILNNIMEYTKHNTFIIKMQTPGQGRELINFWLKRKYVCNHDWNIEPRWWAKGCFTKEIQH